MKHIKSILLLLFFIVIPLTAQDTLWKKLGAIPNGGGIVLNFSEGPDGAVYCCTPFAVYKTTNDGDRWNKISTTLKLPAFVQINWMNVTRFGWVFLATDEGVFKTSDDGATWQRADPPNFFDTPKIRFINSDPWTGSVYAGIPGKLMRTDDSGKTWYNFPTNISDQFRSTVPPRHGTIFFGKNNRMVASLGTNGLYSTNGGSSWTLMFKSYEWVPFFAENSLLTGIVPYTIDFYSMVDMKNIASSQAYTFPLNYIEYTIPVSTTSRTTVTFIDSTKNDFLFHELYSGILKVCPNSCYNGFIRTDSGVKNRFVNCVFSSKKGVLFAGTVGGDVYRSTNKAETWEAKSDGINETLVWKVVPSAVNNDIYIATSTGVYRSDDSGNTWVAKNKGLPFTLVTALAQTKRGTLLASTVYSIYRSTDAGEN
ncbi:MAG: hypothetical protein JNJ85_02480, partial [Candidatus Kapabacteria bacterium]|nr:hypothetical protein [Candidatus Kapabacteria bacterium]